MYVYVCTVCVFVCVYMYVYICTVRVFVCVLNVSYRGRLQEFGKMPSRFSSLWYATASCRSITASHCNKKRADDGVCA